MEFLFLPGFSTADKVTSVSGRGVDLDAARAAVQRLGGSVRVRSELGAGATIRLEPPSRWPPRGCWSSSRTGCGTGCPCRTCGRWSNCRPPT
ncbi:MAG: ATP-binding protein [Desulfotomaculales bacterium]